MKIIVNGGAIEATGPTLADLLEELGQDTAKVATAVNEDFVPVGVRATRVLNDGDRVEIVAPRQGG
ncbi:sulfur carrier protein ThiS [Shimia abyssi]|uniref:Sulfur carrier protein n=1 Tax=Shimia abyssi TaxID=1662395 RepID=A0A2P8EX75_9RHOB|nr:sulfur carrier protein ThiS [Shimia abyssi]PSL14058.1 sulfur carrier protein [Shimia abyssi]